MYLLYKWRLMRRYATAAERKLYLSFSAYNILILYSTYTSIIQEIYFHWIRLFYYRCLFRVRYKQGKLELVFSWRHFLRRWIYCRRLRVIVLRLLPKLVVHLRIIHHLRNGVSDYVDYCRVSLFYAHLKTTVLRYYYTKLNVLWNFQPFKI